MQLFWHFFAGLILAYLLGGIPFALIIGKAFFKTDPRDFGSGNLGATNTFRVLGGRAAIVVLFLDGLKGAIAIIAMRAIVMPVIALGQAIPDWVMVSALLGAVVGHAFSPYLGFKGGKGVAATAGCLFAMQPIAAFICLGIFILIVAVTRYVSLGSVCIAALYPFLVIAFYRTPTYIVFAFIIAGFIIYMHRSNIKRLRAGTESKLSFSQRGSKPQKND